MELCKRNARVLVSNLFENGIIKKFVPAYKVEDL